jgi:hypothetical protein
MSGALGDDCSLRSAFGPVLRNVLTGGAVQSERAACRLQGGCSACGAARACLYPLRLCPSASVPSDVVSRCTWSGQGPRTSRTTNTMSRGRGVQGHTRSGADDESRTRGLGHGVAALCQLSYIRKGARRTVGQYRGRLAQLVKERPPRAAVRSIDRCLRRRASGCGLKSKEARILSESGPLRTELGRCAARRFPLPDALGPRSDQADASLSGRPGARRRRRRPAIPSPRHVRTRPDP